MSQRDNWKVPQSDRPPEQFWIDFGKFVNASMVCDDSDQYWQTLIHWGDVLMNRYDNHVANMMVMDYLDGQSTRSMKEKDK